jgi:hypothetical protein
MKYFIICVYERDFLIQEGIQNFPSGGGADAVAIYNLYVILKNYVIKITL